jgi:hypothetical protein
MEFLRMMRVLCGAAAAGLFAACALSTQVFAAGNYDGTWVVDVPSAGLINDRSNESVCPALRIPIQIHDDQVTGNLQRVATETGAVIVEQGTGSGDSGPVTGTVAPDGTVNAQWQNYHAVGRLSARTGQVTIQGECGPRTATVVRITAPATAGQGGSNAPPAPQAPYGAAPPNPSR